MRKKNENMSKHTGLQMRREMEVDNSRRENIYIKVKERK